VNLPALRDGEDSTQVMVPDKTVGLIIGRGGETIKDLQERSGCHVNILGETKSINGLRPINLIGSVQAVGVAKDLILEIVESDSRGQQQQGTGSNAMNPARERPYDGGRGAQGGSSKTIQVPSQAVGMIIGKGGETIKDLQRTSGCKINVHQPSGQDINRDIDLEGSPRQMEDAERAIWEKVETVQERDGQSGGRGGRAGGGGASRGGSGYDQGSSYDGYSQQQQQPASSGYGQYQPQQQAPAAMPYQMPSLPQQGTPASGAAAQDPAAAAAYQQFYAQWYMQQMMQGQQPGAGAPGQQ
jgi:far upstream element-binding protein